MSIVAKANEVLYVEKYRPQRIDDTILPEQTKAIFKKSVEDESIPNLLLSGGPGVGKTTIAKAMLEELGCDYIVMKSQHMHHLYLLQVGVNMLSLMKQII